MIIITFYANIGLDLFNSSILYTTIFRSPQKLDLSEVRVSMIQAPVSDWYTDKKKHSDGESIRCCLF